MQLLAVAAVAGLGAYAFGKRRERRRIENGYLTLHDNGETGPQYGNLHYGRTGGYNRGAHQYHHHHTRQPHRTHREHHHTGYSHRSHNTGHHHHSTTHHHTSGSI
jgi:hypothetical protein